MEEKGRKILFVCLEIICLVLLLPTFYWGTLKLVLVPIADIFYESFKPILPIWAVVAIILAIDVIWIVLMKLCPKDKFHAKVVLTLLVLTVSAAIISSFIVANALSHAFA